MIEATIGTCSTFPESILKMSEAPEIEKIDYDRSKPMVDHDQIDGLLRTDPSSESLNLELAGDLIELFKSENGRELERLPEVCAGGDLTMFRQIVHFVAGSAGNLGMAHLHAFLSATEKAVDQGKLADLSGAAPKIQGEYEASIQAFCEAFKLGDG